MRTVSISEQRQVFSLSAEGKDDFKHDPLSSGMGDADTQASWFWQIFAHNAID